MKQHFPQKFASLKRLFVVLAILVAGTNSVLAYTESDLTTHGWTKVTTLEALQVAANSGNKFILLDTRNTQQAMSRTSEPRPVYKTLVDPQNNAFQTWLFTYKGNCQFQLRNLTYQTQCAYTRHADDGDGGDAGTWNMFFTADFTRTAANYTFTITDGSWTLQNNVDNLYVGQWYAEPENIDTFDDGEGIASNKSAAEAAHYYIYTISPLATATNSNPVDATYFIQNPSFETGDTQGWTVVYATSEPPSNSVTNSGTLTNKDGNYIFYQDWWTWSYSWDDNSISQTIIGLPAGVYTMSSVLDAGTDFNIIFDVNGATQEITGSGTDAGQIVSIPISLNSISNLPIKVNTYRNNNPGWTWTGYKADNFQLTCQAFYFSNLALPLPNDNSTTLTANQWYYYDIPASNVYTFTGNRVGMVYTTNGNQSINNITAYDLPSRLKLDSSNRIYIKTTRNDATLKLTLSDNEEINFTVCALNVDGLPQEVAGISLNGDGPGSDGTKAISAYLASKNLDILGFSEDFNYDGSLHTSLSSYQRGTYRGALALSGGASYSILPIRFDTDGLNLYTSPDYPFSNESWTEWSTQAGGLTDSGGEYDMLVTKGFRHYNVELKPGFIVDVYVLHMDAGSREGNSGTARDGLDAEARNAQWTQLKDYILANNDNGRPKIIIGDTNSRYTRERVYSNFIDVINATNKYEAKDAWVELVRGGDYPTYGTNDLTGNDPNTASKEIVDKILYINPINGKKIKATAFNVDVAGYKYPDNYSDESKRGKAFGDHAPVIVTFQTENATYAGAEADSWWVGESADLSGMFYVYNVGRNKFVTENGTAVCSDIHSAVKWHKWSTGTTSSLSRKSNWKIAKGEVKQQASGGGVDFGWHNTDIVTTGRGNVYHLHWSGTTSSNWLGIGDNDQYNAGNTSDQSANKEWMIISQDQKDAYDCFKAAYNNAKSLLSLPNFKQLGTLNTLLAATEGNKANYTNCGRVGDGKYTDQLIAIYNAAIAEYKTYIDYPMTSQITNPSFEGTGTGSLDGWTVTLGADDVRAADLSNNTYSFTASDGANLGSYTFNTWDDGANPPSEHCCYQNIDNLPAGCYLLTAYLASDIYYKTDGTDDDDYYKNRHLLYLTLGDNIYEVVVDAEKNVGKPYHVLFYHYGGTLKIGASSDITWKYWFKADNFQLTRYEDYYDVTVTAAQWATVSLPVNTTIPTGVQVYYATEFKDGDSETLYKLHLEELSGTTLPSGTNTNANSKPSGFLIYAETPQVYRFYVTNNTATAPSGNLLNGTPSERIESSARDTNKDQYVLANKTTGVGLYKLADGQGIKRFYAYVEYDKNAGSTTKDGFLLSTNDDTNGIESMNGDGYGQNATGIATIHSLNGARLNTLRRGVNIIRMSDGSVRKVIIR